MTTFICDSHLVFNVYLLGFCLNNTIYQQLVARFAESDMTIDFDNFVACLMRLEMMFRKSNIYFCDFSINNIGMHYKV